LDGYLRFLRTGPAIPYTIGLGLIRRLDGTSGATAVSIVAFRIPPENCGFQTRSSRRNETVLAGSREMLNERLMVHLSQKRPDRIGRKKFGPDPAGEVYTKSYFSNNFVGWLFFEPGGLR
jgi:hypothetical protein